jgi:hypothetical protein
MAIEKLSYRYLWCFAWSQFHGVSVRSRLNQRTPQSLATWSCPSLVHNYPSPVHFFTYRYRCIRYLIDQYDVIQCFSKSGIPSTMRFLSRKQPYGTLAHPRSSFFFWMFTTIDNGKTTWSYPLQTNMVMENASFSSICSMIFPCKNYWCSFIGDFPAKFDSRMVKKPAKFHAKTSRTPCWHCYPGLASSRVDTAWLRSSWSSAQGCIYAWNGIGMTSISQDIPKNAQTMAEMILKMSADWAHGQLPLSLFLVSPSFPVCTRIGDKSVQIRRPREAQHARTPLNVSSTKGNRFLVSRRLWHQDSTWLNCWRVPS